MISLEEYCIDCGKYEGEYFDRCAWCYAWLVRYKRYDFTTHYMIVSGLLQIRHEKMRNLK